MESTRREFIYNVGIALASLVIAGCVPIVGGDGSAASSSGRPRDRLRNCWLRLCELYKLKRDDFRQAPQTRDDLIAEHRAALDAMIAGRQMEKAVAGQVQVGFFAAVTNVWYWANMSVTCYTAAPPGRTPPPAEAAELSLSGYIRFSTGQLIQQADLLAEMATSGKLDPATVKQAQAALERDLTCLNLFDGISKTSVERAITLSHLSDEETWKVYDKLKTAASDPYHLPEFESLDLEITPESAKAAQFLVELLMEKQP